MKCHAFLTILEKPYCCISMYKLIKKEKKKEKRKHKIKKAMVTGKRCFSVRIYLNKFNTVAASLTYNG